MGSGLAREVAKAIIIVLVMALFVVAPAAAEPPASTSETTTASPADPASPDTGSAEASPTDTPSAIDVPLGEDALRFRDDLARKQAELDAFMDQLDELDRELALAAESYNAAVDRLNATKDRVAVAETDLVNAEAAYETQVELLDSHTAETYRNGTFHAIEVLLDSKSLSDFIARVKFLNTIGLADADLVKRLLAQKDYMESVAAELHDTELEAQALEFELKARQIEIMIRIQDRSTMLMDAQSELLDMLDQEAGRRRLEDTEMLQAILSGATDIGVEVLAGGPVETVLAYHGIPYLWGGETPAGFDCSGLIMYVFDQHGVALPHYSGSQFLLGEKVSLSQLMPGDVIFFGSPIHHVGMYIGGGYFVHAPRTGDFVKISRLAERDDFAGARRYDWTPRSGNPRGVYAPRDLAVDTLP